MRFSKRILTELGVELPQGEEPRGPFLAGRLIRQGTGYSAQCAFLGSKKRNLETGRRQPVDSEWLHTFHLPSAYGREEPSTREGCPAGAGADGHGGDGAGAQAAASGIWTAETARGDLCGTRRIVPLTSHIGGHQAQCKLAGENHDQPRRTSVVAGCRKGHGPLSLSLVCAARMNLS